MSVLTALIIALGGGAGIREIIGSGEATRAEIAASEQRIMRVIQDGQSLEREERDKLSAKQGKIDSQTRYQAGLLCALNEGKPHATFPCDGFPPGTKALKDVNRPPKFITDKPYPGATE